jgi:hypothetical protein
MGESSAMSVSFADMVEELTTAERFTMQVGAFGPLLFVAARTASG